MKKLKKVVKELKEINNLVNHDIETDEDIDKLINIVNAINYFLYDYSRKGSGLKFLTPNQMLSKLPITLAQLKQEVIMKNLKTKSGNYSILCTDQMNVQEMFIKVWLTLFKNGNNLYEY